jgi:tetratricopeptide (TPR) repeat protein/transcriptional regulator with XRE-family HTH domain
VIDPTKLAPRKFGEVLRQYRLAAGLTQEELAARSGLSVRAIRDLERAWTGRPYHRSVRLLADALKLTDAQRSGLYGLARDQGGTAVTGLAGPCQLPTGVAQFVGRDRELNTLDELLCQACAPPAGGTVMVSAIVGTAGIGKTALAVHWAHQASARFPGGQLHVNLRGYDTDEPMAAADALAGFLYALGVTPEGLPPGLDARAGLYRSLVARIRPLIVLDNARDAEQVRPLLPGSPGCLVLVTSRGSLAGLAVSEGAHLLTLDVLAVDEARQLLAGRLGAERVAAEPGAVSELIALCARLPLALAIVAARACARLGLPLAGLAAELRDQSGRLDALDTGDPASSVRTVLSWSYDQLTPAGARLFRLLGVHPGPDSTVHAAASLAGTTPAKARRLLDELARANLLAEQASGRFGCHDLLRAYAIEQATTTGSRAARRAALGRLLDYYLHTAAAADRLLRPHRRRIDLAAPRPGVTPEDLASHGQALAWLDAEHRGLLAAVTVAAGHGFDGHAWQLAFSLETSFYRRGHWQDWAVTQRTALEAAYRLGDRDAQTLAHCGVARAQIPLGCPAEALSHLATALCQREEAADVYGQACVHLYASRALEYQRRYREALARSRLGLQLAQTAGAGAESLLADALNQVGWELALVGRYQQALGYCQRAVALSQQIDERHLEPYALDSLAYVHWHLGRHAEAADCYRRAVGLFGEEGHRYRKAQTLAHAGDAHQAAGNQAAAQQAWKHARDILDDLHHPDADTIRAKLTADRPEGRTPGT